MADPSDGPEVRSESAGVRASRLLDGGRSLRDRAEQAPSHQPRTAAILGIALGVTFTICFLTGLYSHLVQHPPSWFHNPSRPAGLYRFTQGLHVATGTAAIPLLLAKLWAVYPRLFTLPARTLASVTERLSVVPLVAGGLFLLFSGTANAARWYPYPFSFVPAHYAVAWITIGALVVHVGAKGAMTRRELRRGDHEGSAAAPDEPVPEGVLTRRGFLGATAAGAGILTLATIGQTVEPLQDLAVLAPRKPDSGVDGVPVNRSADAAGVLDSARSPDYRLVVDGNVRHRLELDLDQLRALPQREAGLPITCVEGWSAQATWGGVPFADLLARAGAPAGASATVYSLQAGGSYATSEVDPDHAADPDTLLALRMNGRQLALDHGYPLRLIAPNRPGVMQTKWVHRVEVR